MDCTVVEIMADATAPNPVKPLLPSCGDGLERLGYVMMGSGASRERTNAPTEFIMGLRVAPSITAVRLDGSTVPLTRGAAVLVLRAGARQLVLTRRDGTTESIPLAPLFTPMATG